ncbi:NAD(P)-binding protein [Hypoxylon trugodes]|uniref:NAD(P)-binding protein n=1 Tax=Hypoxylon trugodes TaxID=326681 RepID=UPI00218DC0FE|nr:NAD(P)-binding protein [Hypoxylon trugodes]KAI1385911.1 NAD(P)-binding protein [Hypoxylon trugodes]
MTGERKTWLITGCSSGFGALFVHQLLAQGDNVIASGRNAEEKLVHLKDSGATILDLDVASPPDIIGAKMAEAWNLYPGGIDVVVNNAGYISSGLFEELSQQDIEQAFKTNFQGPINITQALLPRFRVRGSGTFLYMSSQSAWHPDISATAYCATKSALGVAIECLAKELAIFAPGIKLILVEPGYFRTQVFTKINRAKPLKAEFAEFNSTVWATQDSITGNELGDASRAVSIMIDLVKGTGVAAGKTLPLRIPLGSDGWARIRTKCEDMVKVCDEWEDVAKSTDLK